MFYIISAATYSGKHKHITIIYALKSLRFQHAATTAKMFKALIVGWHSMALIICSTP